MSLPNSHDERDRAPRANPVVRNFNLRSSIIIIFLLALFAAGCNSLELNSPNQIFSQTAGGLAIDGYDAVAYRTIEAAARGNPEYEFAWNGAKWLFSSAANRDRFAANPESYAPEYGGFCAWSLAEGSKMRADPEVWKIVDGKLYLIQSGAVKEVWEKNEPSQIATANENWRKMNDK